MLNALSPLDGRYHNYITKLASLFSEKGLMKHRLLVEIRWFEILASEKKFTSLPPLSTHAKKILADILDQFDDAEAEKVKRFEKTTNHDVKAIEYYLKSKFDLHKQLKPYRELIHFGCTSDDINNLAYALMIQTARHAILVPELKKLNRLLQSIAHQYANLPLLSHTHGQPATPTTLGKEFANFTYRLKRQIKQLDEIEILGKLNSAVGNYNAMQIAYSNIDWPALSKKLIQKLNLTFNPYTTQIEPHDYIAELSHALFRINTIMLDLSKDCWLYISKNYFSLKKNKDEVGSSTMPHKINPIDFENAEGNLGLANALFHYFAEKLPVSRMQRDLSDSTVMRNIGTSFAYTEIAIQSLQKGLNKLSPNKEVIKNDLNQHWEVLAEAAQTLMRKHKKQEPYEQLKKLTRGKQLTKKSWLALVDRLDLPKAEKTKLKQLTPERYTGLAEELI